MTWAYTMHALAKVCALVLLIMLQDLGFAEGGEKGTWRRGQIAAAPLHV